MGAVLWTHSTQCLIVRLASTSLDQVFLQPHTMGLICEGTKETGTEAGATKEAGTEHNTAPAMWGFRNRGQPIIMGNSLG